MTCHQPVINTHYIFHLIILYREKPMKNHVVIFEARGGTDKGQFGFRKDSKAITPEDASGNYVYYGVREFAMTAMMNGLDQLGRPSMMCRFCMIISGSAFMRCAMFRATMQFGRPAPFGV